MKTLLSLIAAAAVLMLPVASRAADPSAMRIAGNFSSNSKHVDEIEKPFFIALPKLMGATMNVNYNPMDVVNVQAADAPSAAPQWACRISMVRSDWSRSPMRPT